jgi:hypothetical protein
MSDGDICSDNKKYGGFGAAMANSLHRRDRACASRGSGARTWDKEVPPRHCRQAHLAHQAPLQAPEEV